MTEVSIPKALPVSPILFPLQSSAWSFGKEESPGMGAHKLEMSPVVPAKSLGAQSCSHRYTAPPWPPATGELAFWRTESL